MTTTLNIVDERKYVRVPIAARMLQMGSEIYECIARKELDAGRGPDGMIYVPIEALRAFQEARAQEAASEA